MHAPVKAIIVEIGKSALFSSDFCIPLFTTFFFSYTIVGYSPMNLNIEELNTAFNVSWETPLQLPAPVTAYVISYRLTSESSATEITVSPNTHYFLLSTYPHYGREYSIEVYAKYPSGIGEPAGPLLQRSSKLYAMCALIYQNDKKSIITLKMSHIP